MISLQPTKKIAAVFMLPLMFGCTTTKNLVVPDSIAGCYESYDQSTYSILRLKLGADGSYTANLTGDVGSWGSSIGHWKLQGTSINLSPSNEIGAMSGLITALAIQNAPNGRLQLVPDRGWKSLSSTRCEN